MEMLASLRACWKELDHVTILQVSNDMSSLRERLAQQVVPADKNSLCEYHICVFLKVNRNIEIYRDKKHYCIRKGLEAVC